MNICQEKLLEILENEYDEEIISEAVMYCALILEKLTFKTCITGFKEIDTIHRDDYNKEEIIRGLLNIFHRKVINPGGIIFALSKSFDNNLKDFYLEVLSDSFKRMDEANDLLFQTIIALDNIGEKIVPSNSMGVKDVQQNYDSVRKYLDDLQTK